MCLIALPLGLLRALLIGRMLLRVQLLVPLAGAMVFLWQIPAMIAFLTGAPFGPESDLLVVVVVYVIGVFCVAPCLFGALYGVVTCYLPS